LEAGKEWRSLDGGRFFAGGEASSSPMPFGEFLESLAENDRHTEAAGDFMGDAAIAGSGHAGRRLCRHSTSTLRMRRVRALLKQPSAFLSPVPGE